jgi:ornithine cyclodeaminase/alanine dehydrogenase-like protein (mu-crystallin family)
MREADDEVMRRGRGFVDSRATTIGHIGEIDLPLASGALTKNRILGDFYDVAAGVWTGIGLVSGLPLGALTWISFGLVFTRD